MNADLTFATAAWRFRLETFMPPVFPRGDQAGRAGLFTPAAGMASQVESELSQVEFGAVRSLSLLTGLIPDCDVSDMDAALYL
jgi:hypothetical protein